MQITESCEGFLLQASETAVAHEDDDIIAGNVRAQDLQNGVTVGKRLRPSASFHQLRSETVRFTSRAAFGFRGGDVDSVEPRKSDESPPRVEVNFLGIATPASFGSLPTPYVEEIRYQERQKNRAMRDFLDLFNHRLISLFYRAWEKYCLPVQYEAGDSRFFERALFGVIGIGTPGLEGRLAFEDRALLSRTGLLAMAPLPAVALESLLESYFEVPVEVEQFLPAWYGIDEDEQNRLGAANSRLGEDLFIGGRVRLSEFKFGLRLGPLDWDRYQEFFPIAAGFHALVDLVRLAVTPELDFETRLVLRAEDVPPLRLEHTPSQACRLGWSTWLMGGERLGDADDAVLVPGSLAAPPRGARPGASLDSMEVRP